MINTKKSEILQLVFVILGFLWYESLIFVIVLNRAYVSDCDWVY